MCKLQKPVHESINSKSTKHRIQNDDWSPEASGYLKFIRSKRFTQQHCCTDCPSICPKACNDPGPTPHHRAFADETKASPETATHTEDGFKHFRNFIPHNRENSSQTGCVPLHISEPTSPIGFSLASRPACTCKAGGSRHQQA